MTRPFELPSRFTALDGWRGVCALMVAAYHFHTLSHFEDWRLIRHSYLLVDFFFVLSGFIISYAYADRLSSWAEVGQMLWRRIGRLWPLHVAVLAAFVGLELAIPGIASVLSIDRGAASAFDPNSSATPSALLTNLLLLHGLGIHDKLTWNIPSWSISAELWVYCVFAIVILIMKGRSVFAATGLAALGALVLILASRRGMAADYDLGFFRCLYGFFIGHLVYRLLKRFPHTTRDMTLVEIGTVVGVGVFVAVAAKTKAEFAAPLVFGFAVWVFAWEAGRVSSFLKLGPMRRLGLYSYSIYMVHALVIAVAHRLITVIEQKSGQTLSVDVLRLGEIAETLSFGGPWLQDAIVVAYLAVVIGLAGLAWRYIEMPCQTWWNGRFVRYNRPSASRLTTQAAE